MTGFSDQTLKGYLGQGVSDATKEKLALNFPIYNFVFLKSKEVTKKEAEENIDLTEGQKVEHQAKNNQDRGDTSSTVYVFSDDSGAITQITRGRDLDSSAFGTGKEKVQVAKQDEDRIAKDKQVKSGKKADTHSPDDEQKRDMDRMVGDEPKGEVAGSGASKSNTSSKGSSNTSANTK